MYVYTTICIYKLKVCTTTVYTIKIILKMKNSNLIIRISSEELKSFEDACKLNGENKSKALRTLINKYVAWVNSKKK